MKILVDDAREITHEQATAYQATGKKPPTIKASKKKTAKLTTPPSVAEVVKRMYIRLEHSEDQDMLMSLKSTIDGRKGNTEVVLVLGNNDNKQIIKLPMRVIPDDETVTSISALVGADNVKLH